MVIHLRSGLSVQAWLKLKHQFFIGVGQTFMFFLKGAKTPKSKKKHLERQSKQQKHLQNNFSEIQGAKQKRNIIKMNNS